MLAEIVADEYRALGPRISSRPTMSAVSSTTL